MLQTRQANRDYLKHILDNSLELVVITCPDAQKSAISVSIGVGHFCDPDDCPGLSHLLEHMLFTGSENYPDGNHLHDFLHKDGGFLNAWTSAQNCNFHFDSAHELLLNGCDVLFDMLLHPLFTEDGIAQEIAAIEAEFSLRRHDDVRRLYDVHKKTANPKHPFTKFSVGNRSIFERFSLSELKSKLVEHHAKYFSAHNMKICAFTASTQIATGVQQKVKDHFSGLANTAPRVEKQKLPALYTHQQKACVINVKPYKSTQTLMLTYCLDNVTEHYRSKPILLLTHLLEDSNKDGLQWYLKNEAYIVDLSASGGIEDERNQDININLRLTEKGLDNIAVIIQVVNQWFDFLRSVGIEKWRFEEKAQQLQLQVTHSNASSAIDECTLLSTRLHKHKLDEALNIDSCMDTYDADFFSYFLSAFKLQNLRVFCIHNDAVTDQVTEQYSAPFSVKRLQDLMPVENPNIAKIAFKLPARNHYMSDNFSLVKPDLAPGVTHEFKTGNIRVRFAQNLQFETPRGDCYFSIESPYMVGSARNMAIKRLWIECISEQLSEDYSGAEMAGINFRVYAHQGGLSIHTSGFSHTQLLLCEEIVTGLKKLKIKPAVFLSMKEKLSTTLKNNLLNKPINQLFSELNILFQENAFSNESILNELKMVYLPELQSHMDSSFNALHIEGLIVGNWTLNDAKQCVNNIEQKLSNCSAQFKTQRRIADIKGQQISLVVNSENTTTRGKQNEREHAIVCYFQAAENTIKQRCIFIAFEKLLSPFIFDELRNKRNLGYLVGCGYMPMNKRPGIAIYVQSPNVKCDHLNQAIQDALITFKHDLEELALIFDNFKNSLAKQFTSDDANTSQYAQRLWVEFDKPIQEQEELETATSLAIEALSFEEFNDEFEKLFIKQQNGSVTLSTEAINIIQTDKSNAIQLSSTHDIKPDLHFVSTP
ncbi:insulinase family protein [Glaciecola sp. MH2013]|uniref:insulinase family protein n=1 Tax=Glaciecola sp. MH2013 TaxID=2785524 RepID=UPI00189C6A84|nr:insulinase family protein [Glaciecola sp. MH2013]MBF7073261.1 insulinase family protein [Glaciecola sp. MH2013]